MTRFMRRYPLDRGTIVQLQLTRPDYKRTKHGNADMEQLMVKLYFGDGVKLALIVCGKKEVKYCV